MAKLIKDNRGKVFASVRAALKKELLVGVPADSAPRAPMPGEKGPPPSNALVGYVMETGDAALNIPARPFLVPGVRAALPGIKPLLAKGIQDAFLNKPRGYEDALDQAGLAAVASVQQTLLAGGFAPLSQRTIEARARRRYADTGKLHGTATSKNARKFLELQRQGTPDAVLHDAGLATPLLDTRSLFRSITHVIRNKGG